jgi:hypothetical protein
VCITHAKVGHRQAPYVVNKNPAHKAGFLLLGSGIAYRCNSGAISMDGVGRKTAGLHLIKSTFYSNNRSYPFGYWFGSGIKY